MYQEDSDYLSMLPSVVKLHRSGDSLEAGRGRPTRLMTLTGMSHPRDYDIQINKINALAAMDSPPDIIGDLSIVRPINSRPLWKRIINETACVSATLPIYSASCRNNYIDASELLDIALEQMEAGVGLLTIHPTSTQEMAYLAQARLVPWTSRGGGLTIRDQIARGWGTDNVYMQILPDLISAAKRYGTVLSLGASFRSANLFDAFDKVQQLEIQSQLELACLISSGGVGVIIESPGHARPADIKLIATTLRKFDFPVMPLGPIPTDTAIGQDHIAAAIGATLFGLEGCAQILACVTREEHTGGIPSIESTVEATRAARVAAHIIDLNEIGDDTLDRSIAETRAKSRTCVIEKSSKGCSRCGRTCPL